eukprot:PhF_6_TR26312/c0_g1_i3/m.37790
MSSTDEACLMIGMDIPTLMASIISSITNGNVAQASSDAEDMLRHHPNLTLKQIQDHMCAYHPVDPVTVILVHAIENHRPRFQLWTDRKTTTLKTLIASIDVTVGKLCAHAGTPSLLSGDVVNVVCSFLSFPDVISVAQVCRLWRYVNADVLLRRHRGHAIVQRRPQPPSVAKICYGRTRNGMLNVVIVVAAVIGICVTLVLECCWLVVALPLCCFDPFGYFKRKKTGDPYEGYFVFLFPIMPLIVCTTLLKQTLDVLKQCKITFETSYVNSNTFPRQISSSQPCNFVKSDDTTNCHALGWEVVKWKVEFGRFVGHCCRCNKDYDIHGEVIKDFVFCHVCGCTLCCAKGL